MLFELKSRNTFLKTRNAYTQHDGNILVYVIRYIVQIVSFMKIETKGFY